MPAATKPSAAPFRLRLLYTPHDPEPKQHAYLLLDELGVTEALYGGAAGGGKSDTLLTAALRYVDVPGYAALLLRKTYADLALPGALMDRARNWLAPSDARWSEVDFRWTFPSGATLSFGYLQHKNDRYRYASAEFQYVGFDELTQFDEVDYRFLFSRIRRPSGVSDGNPLAKVPLRMRAASNPGGRGHEWVKRRFIDRLPDPNDPEDTPEKCRGRIFIPAKLADNPHVDADSYLANLAALDNIERARLRDGDWNADDGDRVYNAAGIDAALRLGELYDSGAEPVPPPAGALGFGLDFGEHTAAVVGYPLEGGGLWVVAAAEYVGLEPGASADRALSLADELPDWEGRPPRVDPVRLLDEMRYDAAGVQSMRTFAKIARTRNPRLKAVAVPFGAKTGDTGKGFKTATLGYLRALFERAAGGERTRVIAISGPRAAELVRQLRALEWQDRDAGKVAKGDDHGPDALVAFAAPLAARRPGRARKPPPDPTAVLPRV